MANKADNFDIVPLFPNEWWEHAKNAKTWKPIMHCVQHLSEVMNGGYWSDYYRSQIHERDAYNKKPIRSINDNPKSELLFMYISKWFHDIDHVLLQLSILKLMPIFIRSLKPESIAKHQPLIIKKICTVTWAEKKSDFQPLCNHILICLWKKTYIPLNDDNFRVHLMGAIQNKIPLIRVNVLDFLSKCAFVSNELKSAQLIVGFIRQIEKQYRKKKKRHIYIPPEIILLCHNFYFSLFNLYIRFITNKDIAQLLGELALNDKNKRVRITGCKCLYSIMRLQSNELMNKKIMSVWKKLKAEKRANNNINQAATQYSVDIQTYYKLMPKYEQKIDNNTDNDENKYDVNTNDIEVNCLSLLDKNWWFDASIAKKWNEKYECIIEILKVLLNGKYNFDKLHSQQIHQIINDKSLPNKVKPHKNSKIMMQHLVDWLENESHKYMRIFILLLLQIFIKSFPKNDYRKYRLQIIQSITQNQWAHQGNDIPVLATNVLIELWKHLNLKLTNDEYLHEKLIFALKSGRVQIRLNALEFISKLTFLVKFNCRQRLYDFVSVIGVNKLFEKLAMTDKNRQIKIATCKFLYAFTKLKIHKRDCVTELWTKIQNEKRLQLNVKNAIANYDIDIKKWKKYNKKQNKIKKQKGLLPDPIGELPTSLWENATTFSNSEQFVVKLIEIACGDEFGDGIMSMKFKNNPRAKEVINLFTHWLDMSSKQQIKMKENILKLLISFANSYNESVWDYMECGNRIAECLICKEWKLLNKNYLSLVTQTLIEIKIASKYTLQNWNKYIMKAIQNRNIITNFFFT
eukprot:269167_1